MQLINKWFSNKSTTIATVLQHKTWQENAIN
jgi:hypothetical protein